MWRKVNNNLDYNEEQQEGGNKSHDVEHGNSCLLCFLVKYTSPAPESSSLTCEVPLVPHSPPDRTAGAVLALFVPHSSLHTSLVSETLMFRIVSVIVLTLLLCWTSFKGLGSSGNALIYTVLFHVLCMVLSPADFGKQHLPLQQLCTFPLYLLLHCEWLFIKMFSVTKAASTYVTMECWYLLMNYKNIFITLRSFSLCLKLTKIKPLWHKQGRRLSISLAFKESNQSHWSPISDVPLRKFFTCRLSLDATDVSGHLNASVYYTQNLISSVFFCGVSETS